MKPEERQLLEATSAGQDGVLRLVEYLAVDAPSDDIRSAALRWRATLTLISSEMALCARTGMAPALKYEDGEG